MTHVQVRRSRSANFFLILTLGILNALTPFTIDLYLPAFPEIAAELNTPVARMSLTVSIYFIGFALGQILYGPLLDRFGRKPPIYVGLTLYLLATAGCMTAQSFEALLAFRFISALGGCAASVGAMSMVRDYFPAKDGAKIFSMLMLVLSASPLLAPSIGGVLAEQWGWRMLFGVLAGLAVIDLLLVAWVLPKGYEPDLSIRLQLRPILRTFLEVLRERQFRAYVFAGSLSFAGLFVFVAGSPALFMQGFGVSAHGFGLIFATLAGGMILGGQLNHLFLRHAPGKIVFHRALVVQMVVGAVLLTGTLSVGYGLYGIVALLFLFLLCAGVTYPNAAALALEPFSKNIGSASALLGFLQLGLGSLAAAFVGLLDDSGARPMAVVMSVCSALGWAYLRWSLKAQRAAHAVADA
jgi:DHA1 family bicyclomycin/chloramphenicol resistance-like MFS transporter